MKVLVINHSQVKKLLTMEECIEVMSEVLKSLARGESEMPLRQSMWLPDKKGLLGMMPGFVGNLKVMGIKAVSVFPSNTNTEYDCHQGVVLLFETEYGRPFTIIDATEITKIRTAAVSAVATDLLARKDARELAILGTGVQGREHLKAMLLVRKIQKVRAWDLYPEKADQFAQEESEKYSIPVEAVATSRDAVRDADIICTTSGAREPILFGDSIREGVHINAVGACFSTARELDAEAVAKAKMFVDRRESALNEAGDFILAKKEGAVSDGHIRGEIGDILVGSIKGRESEEEITLFESLGLAVEDIASAEYVYRKALQKGVGSSVELGGERHSHG